MGFIHGNIPGAVIGTGLGYDLGTMATRKRVREEDDGEEERPKKKGFWKKLWDNGGKHVAIAAGSVAGAYALGKGAQYVDRKTGGHATAAIGKVAANVRNAVGRGGGGAPPRMAETELEDLGPGSAYRNRNNRLHAPDAETERVAEATLHRPGIRDRIRQARDNRAGRRVTYGQLRQGDTMEELFTNPYAEASDLGHPVHNEVGARMGPTGITNRRPSLRPSLTRRIQPEAPPVTQFGVRTAHDAMTPTTSFGTQVRAVENLAPLLDSHYDRPVRGYPLTLSEDRIEPGRSTRGSQTPVPTTQEIRREFWDSVTRR